MYFIQKEKYKNDKSTLMKTEPIKQVNKNQTIQKT